MKLCIAIPYYSQAHALFFRCLQDALKHPPCDLAVVDVIGDSLIPRGRNTLTWKFLRQTDADAMLFIDSDIIFKPGHVHAILRHDADTHPCVGGLYPKKKANPSWVLNTFEDGPTTSDDNGLLEVKYAGTGFMLITRKVLDDIALKYPNRFYAADSDEDGDTRYDYFPAGPRHIVLPDHEPVTPGAERYLSEDYGFCELVRGVGGKVHVDTSIKLEHYGGISFPIAADDVLSRQHLQDMEIGQKTQQFLTNVSVYTSDANEEKGEPARRLVDVDAMMAEISPPPPAP